MNTNFKVVFNKARGALMVANEITSSVQAKGTKTVVAAAVAAVMAGVAGTAMAADALTELTEATVNSGVTLVQKDGEVDATGVVDTATGKVIDSKTQTVGANTKVELKVCSPLVPPRFDAMTENGNSSSGVSHEQIFHLASGIP